MSLNLGARRIVALSEELEKAAHIGSISEVRALLEALQARIYANPGSPARFETGLIPRIGFNSSGRLP